MTGGKRKLAQLFTSEMKIDGSGTTLKRILAGSATIAISGSLTDAADTGACAVTEVTIANLSPCDMLFGSVEGLSACVTYGHVIAGDGQASVVTHYAASIASGSMDGANATLRYIAFKL